MPHDKKGIGKKVESLRLTKKYSQEYMAERLRISQSAYSNIENDRRNVSIDELKIICEVLQADIIDLIYPERSISTTVSEPKEFYGQGPLDSSILNLMQKHNEILSSMHQDFRLMFETFTGKRLGL